MKFEMVHNITNKGYIKSFYYESLEIFSLFSDSEME